MNPWDVLKEELSKLSDERQATILWELIGRLEAAENEEALDLLGNSVNRYRLFDQKRENEV
ncbi:hypothetical protein [Rossellomorea marisflavi]|uniref:hypothetical protein n=1 Tax=Rossellomorea marisflavi TaxID=189381 RepID=UPI003D2EB507